MPNATLCWIYRLGCSLLDLDRAGLTLVFVSAAAPTGEGGEGVTSLRTQTRCPQPGSTEA
jgi:hypothetical protein